MWEGRQGWISIHKVSNQSGHKNDDNNILIPDHLPLCLSLSPEPRPIILAVQPPLLVQIHDGHDDEVPLNEIAFNERH